MKKVLFILAAVLSVAAVSCNKGEKANKLEYTLNDKTYTYTDFAIVYNDNYDGCAIWVFKDIKDTAENKPIMFFDLEHKSLFGKEVALNSDFGTLYPGDYFMFSVPDPKNSEGWTIDFMANQGEFISGSVFVAIDSAANKLDINMKDIVAEGKTILTSTTKADLGTSLKANFRYSGPAIRRPEWGD